MTENFIEVRKSPFVFIKHLVIIEFIFAVFPLFAMQLFDLQSVYERISSSGSISYTFFLVLAFTTIQVLVLCLVFLGWYLPVYQIDNEQIIHRRANIFFDRVLVNTGSIYNIKVRFGPLGRRLDYGTLILSSTLDTEKVQVKDIPKPNYYRKLIDDFRRGASPLVDRVEIEERPVNVLIANGESHRVEFKSSLYWDYREGKVNKHLSGPVMKTVSAFLNTSGGILLIGVSDEGDILGLEADFKAMKKPNSDGFELVFNNAFNQTIGVEFRQFVEVQFPEVGGQQVCMVRVVPATEPAYLKNKGQEEFYIRAGNASQPLSVSKATDYIQKHF